MSTKAEHATKLHENGCNCAQAFVTDTTKTVTVSSSFHAVWVNRELFRELIISLKS